MKKTEFTEPEINSIRHAVEMSLSELDELKTKKTQVLKEVMMDITQIESAMIWTEEAQKNINKDLEQENEGNKNG